MAKRNLNVYELRKGTNLRTIPEIKRQDLVYPELSYKIVGILYDVHDKLGYGLKEKVYQNSVAIGLEEAGLKFKEQVYVPLEYKNKNVGKSYLDFLIEEGVILEIKRGERVMKAHIDQLYQYLVSKNLKLGILAYFATKGVIIKRIINLSKDSS